MNFQNNTARAKKAFAEFEKAGCTGMLVRGDVTDEKEVPRIVAKIAAQLGPVDILVLNATPAQPQLPIEEYDWAFYQQMLDFFVKSPFLFTRACLPHMKQQRWGRIINIGSEVVARGVPNFTAYVAAKGGQNGFTRGLATEVARWGITVNMIAPGFIATAMTDGLTDVQKAKLNEQIPLGRMGSPVDIAAAAVYLASPEAAWVTGATLHINGGMAMI